MQFHLHPLRKQVPNTFLIWRTDFDVQTTAISEIIVIFLHSPSWLVYREVDGGKATFPMPESGHKYPIKTIATDKAKKINKQYAATSTLV